MDRLRPFLDAPDHSSPRQRVERAAGRPACVTSRELMGDHGEVIIVHDGREYRLRITQRGKLILTA